MARFKPYDLNQHKFIPVCYRDQILPGSFEHTLSEIVDEQNKKGSVPLSKVVIVR